MKTKFHGLFFDFSSKTDEALRLEEQLEKVKQEAQLLKEEILNEPKLHEALTTVGIVHDKMIYKKVEKPFCANRQHDEQGYYLDIQDYIEPVSSFQLDVKLGDNNE